MKIGYFAAILKRYKYFNFFVLLQYGCQLVISVHIYGVEIIIRFWWESSFLRGSFNIMH